MNESDIINLGYVIKELRKEKNMTQVELGNAIGKTESTIRKYEANIIEPPLSVLYSITKALGVSLRMFISLIEFNDTEDKYIMLDRLKDSQNNSLKRDGLESLAQIYFSLGQFSVEHETLRAVYENKSFSQFLIWLYQSEANKLADRYSKTLGLQLPITPLSEFFDIISNLELEDYIGAIAMNAIQEYKNRQEDRK